MSTWWHRVRGYWAGTCLVCALACAPQAVPAPDHLPESRDAGTDSGGAGTTTRGGTSGSSTASGSGGSSTVVPAGGRSGTAAQPPSAGISGTAGTNTPVDAGSEPAMLPAFDAGNAADRNAVKPGSICQRLATIQCAGEEHCCTRPSRSRETCTDDLARSCSDTLFLDAIAMDSITGFDAATTEKVFTDFETMASQCDIGVTEWLLGSSGVRTILKGTIGEGQSCKPPTSQLGERERQVAHLASCLNSDRVGCRGESLVGPWTCDGRQPAGEKCTTSFNCQEGLFCQLPAGSMGSFNGRCTERAAVGDSCDTGDECVSYFCQSGSCVAADQQVAFCGMTD